MAKYDGLWHVHRYWMKEGVTAKDGERLPESGFGLSSIWPGYVGMCFPVALYPTRDTLPVKRTEIPIWDNLKR